MPSRSIAQHAVLPVRMPAYDRIVDEDFDIFDIGQPYDVRRNSGALVLAGDEDGWDESEDM